MELNFTKFEPQGDIRKYSILENLIDWKGVRRDNFSALLKKFDNPINNFKLQFSLSVLQIRNLSEVNRMLFTLCKFRKESGTILSLYISEVKNSFSEYNLVFFQRKDGKNVRVYSTEKHLRVMNEYRITITKKKHIFSIKILSGIDFSEVYLDSGDLEGYDEAYNELIVAQGHNFSIDTDDESIGYIKDQVLEIYHEDEIKDISTLEEKDTYEFDVFIAYYQISGKDFASHLWIGLNHSNLRPFRDETNIRYSEEWRKARDKSLKNCKIFILIMTPGYETRHELIYEVKTARENKIPILYCRDANLSDKHLCMNIDGKIVNFSELQLIMFNTKEELFRKVYYQLDEDGWFRSECDDKKE